MFVSGSATIVSLQSLDDDDDLSELSSKQVTYPLPSLSGSFLYFAINWINKHWWHHVSLWFHKSRRKIFSSSYTERFRLTKGSHTHIYWPLAEETETYDISTPTPSTTTLIKSHSKTFLPHSRILNELVISKVFLLLLPTNSPPLFSNVRQKIPFG